jgi:RNA polymerase sigma factor (sigma-70 family)
MKHIYDKHKHWINVVKTFGEEYYAEDVVQEAYLKVYGKEINEAYFYFTLRSLTADLHRLKNKSILSTEIEIKDDSEDLNTIISDSNVCLADVNNFINQLSGYDKLLFKAYINSGLSIRKFAKEIDISFMSVYQTIKKCKQQWQKENQKDLEIR